MIYRSTGILEYSFDPSRIGNEYRVILLIDRGIYLYYRSLMPKSWDSNGQRHKPHISVVRKETPVLMDAWGKRQGQEVSFVYDGVVQQDETYYWINCFSVGLEEVREELGLPLVSLYTGPPSGYRKCFHTTIGNKKSLPKPEPTP